MPKRFGVRFERAQVNLLPGGQYSFDAVSADLSLIATISTSDTRTATGRNAVGKILKVRSDVYFLGLVRAKQKFVVLTQADMYTWWLKEKERGRVPHDIEFLHVDIPGDLQRALERSRGAASKEVSPQ
jgi:hypothetical protein